MFWIRQFQMYDWSLLDREIPDLENLILLKNVTVQSVTSDFLARYLLKKLFFFFFSNVKWIVVNDDKIIRTAHLDTKEDPVQIDGEENALEK